MSDFNTEDNLSGFAEDEAQSSGSLNVLTILTFIGCSLQAIFLLATSSINKWLLEMMDKATASGKELTPKQISDMEKGRAAIELVQAHLVPLMVIGAVSVALCFTGAIWMRKRKKDGFWMYSAGEVLPIISNFIFIGTAQFTGITSIVLGLVIPALFIFLYSRQRKYLIN